MTKFTINAKELKTMMEKGIGTINKKASLATLKKLYLRVEADGTIKTIGTDQEHFLEIRNKNAFNTFPGIIGIDIEDIKIIAKMTGEITLEDISTEKESKINIKCGKKNICIPKYENTDIFLPDMDDTEELILTLKESWLLETIVNLHRFTSDNIANKLCQVYNFNTIDKRVEALDGQKIGIRILESQAINTEDLNPFNTVKLHRMCMPVFKKIMDRKSDAEVKIYQDKKYIRIEGNDFTYIIRRIDGDYFKVNQMLTDNAKYSFTIDKENMLSVMKYDCDIVKQESKPIILHNEDGILYSYARTSKYEILDELETSDITMEKDLFIGFDPKFLVEALEIIDSDKPLCRGMNNKSPMRVDGNEYKFVIMPVFIGKMDTLERFKETIGRNRAA